MKRTVLGIVAGMIMGAMLVTAMAPASADGEGGLQESLTSWVPDMEKIFKDAMSGMFESAGEKITDPEIRAYYEKLTGEITRDLEAAADEAR